MIILINASRIKQGGGIQVTDSICRQLNQFSDYKFIVVLSSSLRITAEAIKPYSNVEVVEYDMPYTFSLFLTGRDKNLDYFVEQYNIDKVLTVFGPSCWVPRVPHLCGFASGQITPQDSPFYSMKLPLKFRIHEILRNFMLRKYYKRCSNFIYSENESISCALRKMFPKKKIFTVTNYYNQVFDLPYNWKKHSLKQFDGISLLTICNLYPHKNLSITVAITQILEKKYPNLKFRFVLTVNKRDFLVSLPSNMSMDFNEHFEFIGTVDINECPSLYSQCDIAFQPTLLECFTATYPEAMRMGKPIVTTDLAFAHQLCGDAAVYYSPLDANAAADAIYQVASDKKLADSLVFKGIEQLESYDNYKQRTEKLIKIIESI